MKNKKYEVVNVGDLGIDQKGYTFYNTETEKDFYYDLFFKEKKNAVQFLKDRDYDLKDFE